MTIKAVSSVNNQTFVQRQQKQSQKNHTAQSFDNSYKLPGYNVSFGMARIDMQELKKNHELNAKYFTPDKNGNIPAFNMDAEELQEHLAQLDKKDARAAWKLLTTINEKNGDTILHNASFEKQKVVHDKLKTFPNKSIAFTDLYLKRNDDGELPAHKFTDLRNFELMKKDLTLPMLKRVFTTEDSVSNSLPSHIYGSEGNDLLQANVIKTFKDDKETLKNIFLHENSDDEYPKLVNEESVSEFMKVFKNDNSFLKTYFFTETEDAKSDDKKISEFYNRGNDGSLAILHKELIDSNPKILKDLYTHSAVSNGKAISNSPEQAKRIIELVVDSDLNEKDSLEVLKYNKELLKENKIENIDLIESYLENKIEENKSISQI